MVSSQGFLAPHSVILCESLARVKCFSLQHVIVDGFTLH